MNNIDGSRDGELNWHAAARLSCHDLSAASCGMLQWRQAATSRQQHPVAVDASSCLTDFDVELIRSMAAKPSAASAKLSCPR